MNYTNPAGPHTEAQGPSGLPSHTIYDYISKEDLEAIKTYRKYKKIREAAGWKPRRFDDKEGILKDLKGEWLGPAARGSIHRDG